MLKAILQRPVSEAIPVGVKLQRRLNVRSGAHTHALDCGDWIADLGMPRAAVGGRQLGERKNLCPSGIGRAKRLDVLRARHRRLRFRSIPFSPPFCRTGKTTRRTPNLKIGYLPARGWMAMQPRVPNMLVEDHLQSVQTSNSSNIEQLRQLLQLQQELNQSSTNNQSPP